MSEVRYWDTDMPINETRVSPNFAAYDRGEYRVQRDRRGAKDFLRDFASGVNQSWKDSQSGNTGNNRGSATASAADRTGQSASKVASQFGQIGDDITIERGNRDKGFTIAGTPGKKGILGHVARGVGAAFAPATFGLSMAAGNFAGDRLDYV